MRTRTKLLSALAVLAAAVPGTILAFPAEALGPNLLPVTVTNNTGRSEAVYLYVLGTMNGRMGYVNASGTFQNWSGGSNPPAPAPDAAIAGPGNGGNKTIQIPRGISGRMWMSLGQKLKFFVTPDGLVQPDMVNPTDPNRDILFDSSEFTYNDSGLWLNSTQVDMFAIPHAVTVTGSNGVTKKTGELLNNGRNTVINQIKAQPDFTKSVITRSDGTVLRVLAPSKATAAGFMNASYLDSAINTAWSTYASKNLTVVPFGDQPSIKFFGRTSGSVMNFTNTSGQQVASFQKPSTMDVWNCDGKLLAPNDNVVGPIARTLCAALHRGTLTKFDTQPAGTAADFYKQSASNVYSGIIHSQMADGKLTGSRSTTQNESCARRRPPRGRHHPHAVRRGWPDQPDQPDRSHHSPNQSSDQQHQNDRERLAGQVHRRLQRPVQRRPAAADVELRHQHAQPEVGVRQRHHPHPEQQVHGRRLGLEGQRSRDSARELQR
jgi:hypothetical protein